ncbi:MAG TPA: hypothetical protein VJ063_13865 [Verrucomicrobiae bacterium]|nr:hypothetical protein [Verrucomicrobiae bacterium]
MKDLKDRITTIALSATVTAALMQLNGANQPKELTVERLIVRKELIVSDTGAPWETGFEEHQIPRGIYARSVTSSNVGGLWVRSRLIKGEIDDPFDDRFHALEKDGSVRGSPGHISWNVWLDGHWRQMAIIQGEGLELSEVPAKEWNGTTHPGRLRFQSFRPGHGEPLTDATIGQGMMSIGGGGYGGGGLPYAREVLQLWGGTMQQTPVSPAVAPIVVKHDGSGEHQYALIAIGPQGRRTAASPIVRAAGLATLRWDSVTGADSYAIIRDGKEIAGPLRIEGSQKVWTDKPQP